VATQSRGHPERSCLGRRFHPVFFTWHNRQIIRAIATSPTITAFVIVSGNAARGDEKSASNRGWLRRRTSRTAATASIQAAQGRTTPTGVRIDRHANSLLASGWTRSCSTTAPRHPPAGARVSLAMATLRRVIRSNLISPPNDLAQRPPTARVRSSRSAAHAAVRWHRARDGARWLVHTRGLTTMIARTPRAAHQGIAVEQWPHCRI
jgi:hypothetical protein